MLLHRSIGPGLLSEQCRGRSREKHKAITPSTLELIRAPFPGSLGFLLGFLMSISTTSASTVEFCDWFTLGIGQEREKRKRYSLLSDSQKPLFTILGPGEWVSLGLFAASFCWAVLHWGHPRVKGEREKRNKTLKTYPIRVVLQALGPLPTSVSSDNWLLSFVQTFPL